MSDPVAQVMAALILLIWLAVLGIACLEAAPREDTGALLPGETKDERNRRIR